MSGKRGRLVATSIFGLATAFTMVLAGCGSSSSGAAAIVNGKGCMKIGVLLPESDSSSRWEGKDHPALQSAIAAALPGAQIDITNANGDQGTQLTQAQADLTKGDCILVLAPHDSAGASAIVQAAKAKQVPVISYDRLTKDPDLNFYVSFDGFSVGVAQGTYIQANYQKYVTKNGNNNAVLINGSHDDNNAILFHDGMHSILDPLFSSKALVNGYETYTQGWNNPLAQTEMDAALTTLKGKIAIAYVANDGMAGTVIASLTAHHLNGKVLVTGQDATGAGVNQILLGNQAMTVYKPIVNEAKGTAQLIAALSAGTDTSTIATKTVANGTANTPSVILPVISVDLTNIASTVLADGYVTKADICAGVPAGTDGIC